MLAKTPVSTVKEIVASVTKSSALDRAEAELRAAVANHNAAHEATRAMIAANTNGMKSTEVLALVAAEAEADKALRAARSAAAPLRQIHGERVAKALRDVRVDAASRIIELVADLRPELQVLFDTMVQIEALGGACTRMPPIDLDHVEHAARRIAGVKTAADGE